MTLTDNQFCYSRLIFKSQFYHVTMLYDIMMYVRYNRIMGHARQESHLCSLKLYVPSKGYFLNPSPFLSIIMFLRLLRVLIHYIREFIDSSWSVWWCSQRKSRRFFLFSTSHTFAMATPIDEDFRDCLLISLEYTIYRNGFCYWFDCAKRLEKEKINESCFKMA